LAGNEQLPQPHRVRWLRWSKAGLVLGAAVIAGATALIVRRDYVRTAESWRAQLSGRVAYRTWMLAESVQESQDDARVLAGFPPSSELLRLDRQGNQGSGQRSAALREVSRLFDEYRTVYLYDPVSLADAEGRTLLAVTSSWMLKDLLERDEVKKTVRAVVLGGNVKVQLIQPPSRGLFLVFAVPVLDTGSRDKPVLGAVAVLDEMAADLFPLLKAEGAATRTGETLLLSLPGGRASYVSPRRFSPASPRHGAPSDTLLAAAALAVEGKPTLGDYLDYRGARVLAAEERVPLLDCVVVCKIDREEAFGSFRSTAGLEVLTALALLTIYLVAILAYQHDLAKRKESEQQIRLLNVALEQRVRDRTAELEAANSELEAFAYSVSHDLRAPLRHLTAFSESLRKRSYGRLEDRDRRYLDKISAAAVQMGKLIDDLLSFSRLGRAGMSKSRFALEPLIQGVRKELEPETSLRNITWSVGKLPEVYADQALLRQVFINLLSNAVKYTRGREAACIEIGSTSGTPDENVIFVRDNGVGFDTQYAHKLFKVFQRLHGEEFEGTGIGLANIRRIIERHGGRVWADGAPQLGATFYFSIPVREKASDG